MSKLAQGQMWEDTTGEQNKAVVHVAVIKSPFLTLDQVIHIFRSLFFT